MRVCGYVVVAVLCFVAARREKPESPGSWPPFWILTGALFVIMALGRAGDVADLMTDTLRQRAVSQGWYRSRRHVQALVVAGLGLSWLIAVLVAVWRVPSRRRRYLPMIVVVLTVGFYAAIRIVSLHQLDSVLYRRQAAGMRYGTLIEFGLLVVAAAVRHLDSVTKTGADGRQPTEIVAWVQTTELTRGCGRRAMYAPSRNHATVLDSPSRKGIDGSQPSTSRAKRDVRTAQLRVIGGQWAAHDRLRASPRA